MQNYFIYFFIFLGLINFIYLFEYREMGVKTIIIMFLKKTYNLVLVLYSLFYIGFTILLVTLISYKKDSLIFNIIMAIFLLIITVQRGILIDIWNRISLFNIRSNSYEREAPIDLSPAVLSYIINGRIESNKDIVATILNLSAKGYIKLRKDQEELVVEKTNFIHNNTVINTSEELRPDEKYIYEWLTQNNGQNYNMNNWYKIIEDEAEKTKYIRKAETYITYILLAISAVVGTISYTHRFKFGIENIIAYLSLLLALPACIYEDSRKSGKVGRKFYTYTKEGKLFLKKVSGFKKYIKDFSIIKNRELEEVYLWEEYLAYSMVLNINRKYYKKTIKQLGKYTDIDLDTKILTI